MNCPVCQSNQTTLFIQRESVPVHQNVVIRSLQEARNAPVGTLELVVCERCGFIFNRAFDPAAMNYEEHYDNNQNYSCVFQEHVADRARYLNENIKNSVIIEIGCGNGEFLRQLVSDSNIGYGIDPAYTGLMSEKRATFKRSYFSPDVVDVLADVVICRHVIEHIQDPLRLLNDIKQVAKDSARIFIETPNASWILRNQASWDFFYEHCSYFSAESLTCALNSAGIKADRLHNVFDGQYLWLEASLPGDSKQGIPETAIPVLAHEYVSNKDRLIDNHTAIWGAGAKGVTFANLIDPEMKRISCVVDINPNKQGCFIPCSGHPIISYAELGDYHVETIINMNPNYFDENEAILHDMKFDIDLIGVEELL